MSKGTSSINLAGELKAVTARRSSNTALTQIVGEIIAKTDEANIAISAVDQVVTLPFSPGVDELVFLSLYSAKKLIIEITTKDSTVPGPMRQGLKGHYIATMQPGEGITTLRVTNPSADESVLLEIVSGCVANAGDIPSFFA